MSQPQENALHDAFSRLPVMVIAWDERGNIIAWNRQCEKVTGYLSAEVTHTTVGLFIPCLDRAVRRGLPQPCRLQGKEHLEWVGALTTKAGESKTILWSIPPGHFRVPGWPAWLMGLEIAAGEGLSPHRKVNYVVK